MRSRRALQRELPLLWLSDRTSVVVATLLTMNGVIARRSCLVFVLDLLIEIPGIDGLILPSGSEQPFINFVGVCVTVALALFLEAIVEVSMNYFLQRRSDSTTPPDEEIQ